MMYDAYYVNEHFKEKINISYEEQLDNELIMHYNIFSRDKQNRFILEYLGIDLKEPVIILNENKSDVDMNLHKILSKNKRQVKSCESRGDLMICLNHIIT
jgi:hypothetical protein